MRSVSMTISAGVLLAGLLLLTGCGKTGEQAQTEKSPAAKEKKHEHPDHGPHKGDLIELGKEEYHAELVHPEDGGAKAVTIYILDSSATKQVPIDAKTVALNMQHEGKPEQFTLNASPDEGDPEGQSSRFTSEDPELLAHFAEDHVHGELVVKIKDNSFRGELAHEHKD